MVLLYYCLKLPNFVEAVVQHHQICRLFYQHLFEHLLNMRYWVGAMDDELFHGLVSHDVANCPVRGNWRKSAYKTVGIGERKFHRLCPKEI